MIQSDVFRKLSPAAVKILIELASHHNGFNNGRIVCAYSQLQIPLGLGKATIHKGLKELQEKGFIICTKKGYYTGRKASIWEVTFLKSDGYTPTDMWKPPEQRPMNCRPPSKTVNRDIISETATEINRIKVLKSNDTA